MDSRSHVVPNVDVQNPWNEMKTVRSLSLEASRFGWFLCNFWEPKLSSLDAPFWRELPPKFEPHPVLIWCEIGWLDSNIGCFRIFRSLMLKRLKILKQPDVSYTVDSNIRCWLDSRTTSLFKHQISWPQVLTVCWRTTASRWSTGRTWLTQFWFRPFDGWSLVQITPVSMGFIMFYIGLWYV